jgi:hypothetical protein
MNIQGSQRGEAPYSLREKPIGNYDEGMGFQGLQLFREGRVFEVLYLPDGET